MHNIGFFADIQYADILQLIRPITDTIIDTYVYFFFVPNCRDHQVSTVVEFTHSIIMHTLLHNDTGGDTLFLCLVHAQLAGINPYNTITGSSDTISNTLLRKCDMQRKQK